MRPDWEPPTVSRRSARPSRWLRTRVDGSQTRAIALLQTARPGVAPWISELENGRRGDSFVGSDPTPSANLEGKGARRDPYPPPSRPRPCAIVRQDQRRRGPARADEGVDGQLTVDRRHPSPGVLGLGSDITERARITQTGADSSDTRPGRATARASLHSIGRRAMADGSRPASSQPPTVAISGRPTRTSSRSSAGVWPMRSSSWLRKNATVTR